MKVKSLPELRLLHDAYDPIITPIFVISAKDFHIEFANLSATHLIGCEYSNIQGKPFIQIFCKPDHNRILLSLESGKGTGTYSESKLEIYNENKKSIIVNLSGHRAQGNLVLQDGVGPVQIVGRGSNPVNDQASIIITLQDITKTAELAASQTRTRTILNSSLQGFLTFTQDLKIESDYSARAEEFLGPELTGKHICDALNLNRQTLIEFVNLAFQKENWEILDRLATMESKMNGRILKLDFAPVIDEKEISRILVTITDITLIKRLEQRTDKHAKETRAIIKILQSKPIFLELVRVVNEIQDTDESAAKNYAHTLKGEFSFFECQDLVELCEFWERRWTESYEPGDLALFLRQFRSALNRFLYKYKYLLKLNPSVHTELIIPLERIKTLVKKMTALKSPPVLFHLVESMVERPIEDCLEWLGETWLMVASTLGKSVNPILWRKSAPIFEEPYKKLFFALVHAVRNSADHGIESAEERVAAGKTQNGNLFGEFEMIGDFYHLRLIDDGRGIQLDAIKAKAIQEGLSIPSCEADIYNLLFENQFTTCKTASEISGRGIGLHVVRTEARALGGDATLSSSSGTGLNLHVWFKRVPILKAISRLQDP